jgi:hypothetical protein
MMEKVLFNYVVDGVVIDGPMSYAAALQRSGLKDTVGLAELGYQEVMAVPTVPEITPEQIQTGIRGLRSHLLERSDWTQVADAPLSAAKKAEWATYRQALRDMPETYASATSIADVTVPTEPTK